MILVTKTLLALTEEVSQARRKRSQRSRSVLEIPESLSVLFIPELVGRSERTNKKRTAREVTWSALNVTCRGDTPGWGLIVSIRSLLPRAYTGRPTHENFHCAVRGLGGFYICAWVSWVVVSHKRISLPKVGGRAGAVSVSGKPSSLQVSNT